MKTISFSNYKAFNKGEIEIKPLTIILGANSSGKSSLLQLFLMLEQTINNQGDSHQLKLNGRYVNLGEDENIFKDKDSNKVFSLEFTIDSIPFFQEIKGVQNRLQYELTDFVLSAYPYLNKDIDLKRHLKEIFPNKSKYQKILEFTSHKDEFIINSSSQLSKKKIEFYNQIIQEQLRARFWGDSQKDNLQKDLNVLLSQYITSTKLYKELYQIKAAAKPLKVSYQFMLDKTSRKLTLVNHSIFVDDKILVSYAPQKNPSIGSEIFNVSTLKGLLATIKTNYSYHGITICPSHETERNSKIDIIYNLLSTGCTQIENFFMSPRINYVGPLRAYPQRYYFLDGSDEYSIKSGEGLANILKNYENVRSEVNKWLNKFGLSVKVNEFKDIIHNIKVHQNNLLLDLTDVGFGISQVLPILVQGFLSQPNSTTIIEQPEIHLHPKMQAELADLFIDIVNASKDEKKRIKKRLIIETHSEYFLKRLRRRIAEGDISSKEVAIYFIEPRTSDSDHAEIKKVKVDADGTIDWPTDFYITELEDDMAFFKSKIKNKKK